MDRVLFVVDFTGTVHPNLLAIKLWRPTILDANEARRMECTPSRLSAAAVPVCPDDSKQAGRSTPSKSTGRVVTVLVV